MKPQRKASAHILLAFADSRRQDEVEKYLHHSSFQELWDELLITDVGSVPLAQKTLSEEEVDICILGPQFGDDDQEFLIRSVTRRLVPGKTLMIPISATDDKAAMLRFIQAGAHGILVEPITPESLHRVVGSALSARHDGDEGQHEEIASLPYLLEHLAARLQGLAVKLREKEPEGGIEASSKLIKEALLGVIGSDARGDEQTLDRIADFLLKSSKHDGGKI